ncbi:hypothetical protein LPJ72_003732 [Coemansia sp. Benny D160-2]|nr:hypothetical protein LPJ72_003732 [Coemansia sp. Benny D160-2]
MFGSVHNQNKENAVLGSVARTGKAGLLGAKGGGTNNTLQPGKGGKGAVSDKAAQFGTPAHPNTMTPGKQKALDGKQSAMVTRKGLRDTLAQTPLTRNTKPTQRSVAQKADKTAMTVKKRRLGLLFASDIQNENKASIESSEKQQNMEILQLLEPEYAPSVLSASSSFNALDEFGCDLDVALVPTTQLSTSKAEARKLPELDLGLEPLIESTIVNYDNGEAYSAKKQLPINAWQHNDPAKVAESKRLILNTPNSFVMAILSQFLKCEYSELSALVEDLYMVLFFNERLLLLSHGTVDVTRFNQRSLERDLETCLDKDDDIELRDRFERRAKYAEQIADNLLQVILEERS